MGLARSKEPPKLTVDSGDTVSIETMMHSHDKVRPGIDGRPSRCGAPIRSGSPLDDGPISVSAEPAT
jgi:hypothetical protein